MTDSHLPMITDYLEQGAINSPERPVWYYEDRYIGFGEVNTLVDRVASGLLARGYRKGDKLGIIAHNQPEWLVTYLAALKIGVVLVGLSVRYRDEELVYILNQSGARGIVALAECNGVHYANYLEFLQKDIPGLEDIILIEGPEGQGSSFAELASTPIARESLAAAGATITADTPSIIIYTSGTTGKPKGAVLSHRSQLASARAQAAHLGMTEEDVVAVIPPLNHVGGLTCGAVAALAAGSCALLVPQFSPAGVIEQLTRCPVTIMGAVPTMYTLLMQHPDFSSLNREAVRALQVGGAPLDQELLGNMRHYYPNVSVMNNYGMSETSGFVLMSKMDDSDELLATSVGVPVSGVEVKIIDGDGGELPAGEVGELCIRSAAVIDEYYRMPEQTAEAKGEDGWLRSGDIALIDGTGHVHLKGRQKEMYLQGGFNVYPVEVENVLTQHPEVLIAAGIGVPDDVLGEVGRFFIIRTPGSALTEETVLSFCRERMANYKVPRHIVFRDELPMTPAGKVMKSKLN